MAFVFHIYGWYRKQYLATHHKNTGESRIAFDIVYFTLPKFFLIQVFG